MDQLDEMREKLLIDRLIQGSIDWDIDSMRDGQNYDTIIADIWSTNPIHSSKSNFLPFEK